MVLNCGLVTYIMMTADLGLPDAVKRHTQDMNISSNLTAGHMDHVVVSFLLGNLLV